VRLSQYLRGVGDPLYYYPRLARVVGGVKACILLCRLIQWSGHEHEPERGIHKSFAEIMEETGMTLDEAKAASKTLKNLGIIEKDYARLRHRLYHRINFDRLDALWEAAHPESGKSTLATGAVPPSPRGKRHRRTEGHIDGHTQHQQQKRGDRGTDPRRGVAADDGVGAVTRVRSNAPAGGHTDEWQAVYDLLVLAGISAKQAAECANCKPDLAYARRVVAAAPARATRGRPTGFIVEAMRQMENYKLPPTPEERRERETLKRQAEDQQRNERRRREADDRQRVREQQEEDRRLVNDLPAVERDRVLQLVLEEASARFSPDVAAMYRRRGMSSPTVLCFMAEAVRRGVRGSTRDGSDGS